MLTESLFAFIYSPFAFIYSPWFIDVITFPVAINISLIYDYISLLLLKPGSHTPPMHLRHGRWYCLGYCSDMRTEVAGNIAHSSLHPQHACEVDSSSTSQASRRLSPAMAPVAGGTSSHSSEKCPRRYWRSRRRYIGIIWEPGFTLV